MAASIKWLTLNTPAAAADQLPENIRFDFKKPFITASFVLAYSANDHFEPSARAELSAKIPIKGLIRYSVEVQAPKVPDQNFAFSKITERDEVGGSYRTISAAGQSINVEKSNGILKSRELTQIPPAPLLAHLLAFPALQRSREASVNTYAALLVNGSRFQALRLERISTPGVVETYRGSLLSLDEIVTEEQWLQLPWQNATTFDFHFDAAKGTLKSAVVKLPVVGKIEIK